MTHRARQGEQEAGVNSAARPETPLDLAPTLRVVPSAGADHQPELAQLTREALAGHEMAEAGARMSVEGAIKAGDALNVIKAQLPHGAWLTWLEANTPISPRRAQKYMRIAKSAPGAHLPADATTINKVLDAISYAVRGPESQSERQEQAVREFRNDPALLRKLASELEQSMVEGKLDGTGYSPDDVDDLLYAVNALPEVPEVPFAGGHAVTYEEMAERHKLHLRQFVLMYPPDAAEAWERNARALMRRWKLSTREVVSEALALAARGDSPG